jgi:hypothetical protein
MKCLRCKETLSIESTGMYEANGSVICEDYTEHPHDGGHIAPSHVPTDDDIYHDYVQKTEALQTYDDHYRIHHDMDAVGCDVCVEDPPPWILERYPDLAGAAV